MHPPHSILRREDGHAHAIDLLSRHVRLPDYGRCCPAGVLLSVLLAACAYLRSLAAACARLRDAPCDETIRQALLAGLPDYAQLQRRLNRALQGDLPKALRRRRQPLAIDLVLIPYYGEPAVDAAELYRGQPQAGTSRFHAYATAYVLRKGRRYTVGLTGVAGNEPHADLVRRLLRQAARAGVRARLVLLDRGFFTVPVVRYLQAARQPFVILMPCRGRRPDHPRGPGGTQRLCYQKRSGWHTHSWCDEQGRRATVSVCVRVTPRGRAQAQRRPTASGQGRRRPRKPPGRPYAFWGWQPSSYRQIDETYRRRFASETTYRQLHQGRIPTCARSPELRLLFVGLALVLRNVWVWVHYHFLAGRRRGGRLYHWERLRFQALLDGLADVAETRFGITVAAAAEVLVQLPLPPPAPAG